MKNIELQRLAAFSGTVRSSTITKLQSVPPGRENWRMDPAKPSFSDIARHLLETDRLFIQNLATRRFSPYPKVGPGAPEAQNREEYEGLLRRLESSQREKEKSIKSMSQEELEEWVDDPLIDQIVNWWSIIRSNVDHEMRFRDLAAASLKKVWSSLEPQSRLNLSTGAAISGRKGTQREDFRSYPKLVSSTGMVYLYWGFGLLLLFFTAPRWLFLVATGGSAIGVLVSKRIHKSLKTPLSKFRL